jgi:DNA polymerase-3 subunit alpha
MSFTHLHCHSHYSLLDGLSKIDDLVNAAQEREMAAVAITDHGVMYGAIEFYNACKAAGIKPIIGMEAYIAPRRLEDKEGRVDADYYHLTLLAKNYTGYLNLMQLATIGNTTGFYYKPRIDKETLKQYSEGLIALSGCQRGEIARAFNASEAEAQRKLEEYVQIFGRENFFLEVQRNALRDTDITVQDSLNNNLVTLGRNNGVGIVATADSHYINTDDAEAQDIMVCIGTGRTVQDTNRLDMRSHNLSFRTSGEMEALFADLPEAISNTELIASLCALEIPVNQRYFPRVRIPEHTTSESYLREIVLDQAKDFYGDPATGMVPDSVMERVNYELDIICTKGFAPYFLMVAKVVEGARELKAFTNTRGSAAGSIVGKILRITNVDPLYYELPFERFLTLHRPTPPDIDLDIADNRRDEVIEWMTHEFGKDKVAQIITFGTMKARAAVRDVGRALAVSYGKCDRIAKMIPLGKQGFDMTLDKALDMNAELKQIYNQDPETHKILTIARKLEGCARHASIHAAGIVITPEPLTQYMPLQREPDGERMISQYDMYSLDVNAKGDAIGVVKLDLLGIRNLSTLEEAVKLVRIRHGKEVDIYNLPHPDPKTFKLLSDGLTFGVFQLGSSGMTHYLRDLKPNTIFEIMAMIALYRPGPMQFLPDYIRRKHNQNLVRYLDPALEKILHRTYGILVYQDDLLTIAHDLAGYTLEEVDKFRKAVGKKIPAEMAKQKIKFIQGCQETSGWSHAKANEVWNWIEPFAAYGFNKAHSASYAVVSYQTAYMKANYPVEFMAAVMTAESGDEEKIYAAVEECRNLGITVLPPDVTESYDNFTVINDTTIRFGLNAIKNLGSDVVEKIIECHKAGIKFNTLQEFLINCQTKNLNKKSWEALIKSGALDKFGERNQLLFNTESVLSFLREQSADSKNNQTSLFGNTMQFGKIVLKDAEPAPMEQKLLWEKEYLGLYVSAHPLDSYKKVLAGYTQIATLPTLKAGSLVTIGGLISKYKRTLTKKNDPMAFFTLQDPTGIVEVLVFPKLMIQAVPYLDLDKMVQVNGKISDKDGEMKIIAEEISPLPNDELYTMALSEMEKSKEVVIYLNDSSQETLLKIKNIIEAEPGYAQVYLHITGPSGDKKLKTNSQVRVSGELIQSLRALPQIAKVSGQ